MVIAVSDFVWISTISYHKEKALKDIYLCSLCHPLWLNLFAIKKE